MNTKVINWYGSFGEGQGYSGMSENIVRVLVRKGLDIRTITYSKTPNRNLSKEFQEIKAKTFELGKVGIFLGFPNGFSSIQNEYKIGYTMFETDKLPNGRHNGKNDWAGKDGDAVDKCNQLNELWVPCHQNKEVFEREGVTVPIKVVPAGVDPTEYYLLNRDKRGNKPFTYLMLGTLTARKNPGAVISAFMALFGDRKDVKLVLKTQDGTLGHLEFPTNNIEIIDKPYPRWRIKKLYADADCFVFPTRGEGFGLPPVEAMATGLPVIFADHTGMHEFANDKYNYPIRKNVLTPAFRYPHNWGDVGNWYEPDYEEFKTLMKYVFDHKEEAKAKGLKASKWVRSNWTTNNTANKIIKELRRI